MTLTFADYVVLDDAIQFHFVSFNPGAGQLCDYYVQATDAELAAVTTQAQLRTLVVNKLSRKLRATGIATKLDPFIGQSLVI